MKAFNLNFWKGIPLSILLVFGVVSVNAQIPTNGLIAYYPFSGNANDASGNGFNGTVIGAILTTDRFGNANSAYSFNGTNNYITVPDNNTLDIGTSDYTLSAWIKTSSAINGRIISKGSTNCSTGYMMRTNGANVWTENAVQPTCNFFTGSTKVINNNVWHCVTVVVSRSTSVQIFVDGVLDKSIVSNNVSSNLSNTFDLRIGINETPVSAAEWFNGSIDDIRMYNRALTSIEVGLIYNEPDYLSCRYRDSLQLVSLYNETGGANWTNKWDLSQPMTTWYGITLNASGCVTCIDMDGIHDCIMNFSSPRGNNLVGTLPDLNLPNLILLTLPQNRLSGTIPDLTLTNLIRIDLSGNQFTQLPNNLNLPNLLSLFLPGNRISGQLPDFNLPNLYELYMYGNGFTGSIPNFSKMLNLRSLELSSNKLSGSIPDFDKLPNLTELTLYGNQLSGALPPLQSLTSLKRLYLSDNNLSGCFPPAWSRFCSFSFQPLGGLADNTYNITNNPKLPWQGDFTRHCNSEPQIGATCDDGISTTANDKISADCVCRGIDINSCRYQDSLQLVSLYNETRGANWTNKWDLAQPMTTWYGVTLNATGCVTQVILDNNNLIGTLPNLSLNSLQEFNLSINKITGSIPNLSINTLQGLYLNDNLFSDNIPVFNLPQLKNLYLFNNQLTGAIPSLSLPNLQHLYLHTNRLNNTIPTLILPSIITLHLYNNQLIGSIPTFDFPVLQDLNLSINQLSGTVPLLNFPALRGFYINDNLLTGCIPQEIKTRCPLITATGGNISNNPNLTTQSWANYWNNGEGACPYFNIDKVRITPTNPTTADNIQIELIDTLIPAATICYNLSKSMNLVGNQLNINLNFSESTVPCSLVIKNANIESFNQIPLSAGQYCLNYTGIGFNNLSGQTCFDVSPLCTPCTADYKSITVNNITENTAELNTGVTAPVGSIYLWEVKTISGTVVFIGESNRSITATGLSRNTDYKVYVSIKNINNCICNWGGGDFKTSCTCTQQNVPVCGSDNIMYPNACFAACAGVSVIPSPTVTITGNPTICQGASTTLTANPSGGFNYTYQWTKDNITIQGATNQLYSPNTAGNYNVIVTSNGGCFGTAITAINTSISPTPTAPSISSITQPTCTTSRGSVVLSGLPTSTWTINPGSISASGSTSITINNLTEGTYDYTVANAAGCTSLATPVTINAQPTTPTAPSIGTITQPTCSVPTGSVVLNGLPSGTWTINPGNITGTNTTRTITGLTVGTYNYTITNAAGCTSLATTNIIINAAPTPPSVLSSTPSSRCGTGTVTLQATASAGTLNWYATSTGGTILSTGTSFTTPSISTNTTYYVEATNNGCTSATRTAVVATVTPEPEILSGTSSNSRCGTGSVLLNVTTNAVTVNWYATSTGTTIIGTGTSFTTPSISTTTTYYAEGLNGSCTSGRAAFSATINPIPTITNTTPNNRCGTGAVTLQATASAGTLNWYAASTGGTSLSTGTSFTTPSISTNTTYYVEATDNGCTSASRTPVIATINSIPTTPSVISTTQPTCTISTGSIELGGLPSTGTWTLTRFPGSVTTTGQGISTTIPGLSSGRYVFNVLNAEGCRSNSSANIDINSQPPTPAITLIPTQPTCNQSNGSITTIVTGGTTPFTYRWSNGATSSTLSNLAANTTTLFSVTVTDANNCSANSSVNLTCVPAACNNVTITKDTSFCEGKTYTLPKGTVVSVEGTYRDTFKVSTCDSVIVTNLTVRPAERRTLIPSVCASNYTLPDGRVVTSSGTYTAVRSNAAVNGCDSIYTINLTLSDSIVRNVSASINQGQNYNLPSGVVVSAAGTYRSVLKRVSGCDSIINTTLTVNNFSITNGLIGHYLFDGNARDTSGNGNHGTTFGGVTWVKNRFGSCNGAANFNGINAYIKVNQSVILEPTSGLTMSAWVNIDSTTSGAWIIRKSNAFDAGYIISLLGFGNDFQIRLTGFNLSCIDASGADVPNFYNNWIYLTGTYDLNTQTAKLYVNGILVDTKTNACYRMEHTGHLFFAGNDFETNFMKGTLDDIRIYNRALSSTEIQQLYTINEVVRTIPLVSVTSSSSSICNGNPLTITVNTSESNLQYQWSKNGQILTGQIGSSLQVSQSGNYSVKISNANGCDTIITKIFNFDNSCRCSDSLALIAFYNATGGQSWKRKDNWLSNAPISTWYGVHLNPDSCVITLDFDGNNTGIGDDGQGNNITGVLPEALFQLSELNHLYLSGNRGITGSLPNAIGRLSKMKNLHFDNTGIAGSLPDSLWLLKNISGLNFSNCAINASLPNGIGNLDSLSYLIAVGSKLTGDLPSTIFNCRKMRYFNLANNAFTGSISPNISQMTDLQYFNLGSNGINGITGSIPTSIGQLKKLETLILGGNQLNGIIPTEIGNCTNLQGLYLSDNKMLSGAIPTSIGNLKRLKYLWLQGNDLSGEIPAVIGNLDTLEDLVLSRNKLAGAVPNSFNQLKVKRLFLDNNRLVSVPNLTNVPLADSIFVNSLYIKQAAGLWLHNNILTFEDVLPNRSFAQIGYRYTPQDTIFKDTTINAKVGDPLSIDLKIDGALTTNSYQWYKNGQIYGSPLMTNKFIINALAATDAGMYDVRVTNPGAPLLILLSKKITINVSALPTRNRNKTICEGATDTLPSGKIVSVANTYSDTLKNRSGLDSAIVITNLKISPKIILNFGSFQACRGQSNGSVSLTIQGGTAPFNYQWDNGVKTANLTNVAAGSYRVTVTDIIGCQNDNAIVVNSQAPKAMIVGKDSICPNETALLTASGGVTYLWNGGNQSNPLSISRAGVYTVIAADDKGCKDTTSKSVFIKIPIQKRVNRVLCQGDKFNNIVINKDTVFTETYCDSIVTTTIRISKEMSFALAPKQACEGQGNGSIALTITGGLAPYTYVWSNQTTQKDALNLPPNDYRVIVTDSIGCVRTSDRITISSVPSNKAAIAGKDSICLKESILLSATGGTSYEWSNSQLPNKPTANPLSISRAGKYIVVATDVNGCTAKDSITVRNVQIQNITVDTTICEGSLFKNRTINADVSFSDTIGCNRVELYRIKVKKVQNINRNISVCKDEYVEGILIQKDTLLTKTYGCDSLVKLSVSIKPVKTGSVDLSVCKGESINGVVINNDTILRETVRCDSVILKRIKVNPTYNISLKDSAFIGENYKGTVIRGDTTLTFRDTTKTGCDSVTNIQIFIKTLSQSPCQKRDAPILAALYNATNGNGWAKNINWLSNEPLSRWHGVKTNTEGCVTEISLSNNNLNGTLPNLVLPNLEVLVLSKNQLTGNIPDFNLPKLKSLILFENSLSGIVPSLDLPELESFQFHKNKIDSCPPLLKLKSLKKDTTYERGLRAFGNKLTFDDILPNINFASTTTFIYAPQNSIYTDTTFEVSSCSDLEINLGIDGAISDNKYVWKKDGNPFREEKTNKLLFSGIDEADEGIYTCEVTNERAKGLTLISRPIRIKIDDDNSNNPLKFEFFNGLTPNGDGKNDVFLIEGIEKCTQNSLVILNRFGETVFKKDGYQNDWNGVDLKGNNLPEGQYYFVFYPKKGGKKYMKGTVLILR
jgi:gliding motility-associated-like protein